MIGPHDRELIEHDAREIYRQWAERDWRGRRPAPPWEKAPEMVRQACRRVAANPYEGLEP